ncbi:MAG: hypothetical protein HN576_05820 [Bacteriovoracaceae bacterium]|jgi:hypothetical protein|nr:hypothetical protein [Bacteriovoracaceae bacterium]
MSAPIHFYMTFNPKLNSYSDPDFTQAHEFYEYLQAEIKKKKDGHAYWGKIISTDREKTADTKKMHSIVKANNELGHKTHLYLTDFQNLWVANVTAVKQGIGKDTKTLGFYKDKKVEVWFQISDFTILEYCPDSTATKLSELYIDNEHSEFLIEGISPFTSGIKYPALVQDLAEEDFFDELNPEEDGTHLVLKNPEAITNIGSAKIIKTLNHYTFPELMYQKLPHGAKAEIEAAELDMVEQRHHNLNKMAFSYIKALEITINHLVIGHIRKSGIADDFFVKPNLMPPKMYLNEHDEIDLIPLAKFPKNFSITQLIYFIERVIKSNRLSFNKAFSAQKPFLKWFTNEFPKQLDDFQILKIRGVLAHNDADRVNDHDLLAIRSIIMGIGSTGLIQQAMKKFYPEINEQFKVLGSYTNKKYDSMASKKNKKKNHLKAA